MQVAKIEHELPFLRGGGEEAPHSINLTFVCKNMRQQDQVQRIVGKTRKKFLEHTIYRIEEGIFLQNMSFSI
jgi:hypothetical protein